MGICMYTVYKKDNIFQSLSLHNDPFWKNEALHMYRWSNVYLRTGVDKSLKVLFSKIITQEKSNFCKNDHQKETDMKLLFFGGFFVSFVSFLFLFLVFFM